MAVRYFNIPALRSLVRYASDESFDVCMTTYTSKAEFPLHMAAQSMAHVSSHPKRTINVLTRTHAHTHPHGMHSARSLSARWHTTLMLAHIRPRPAQAFIRFFTYIDAHVSKEKLADMPRLAKLNRWASYGGITGFAYPTLTLTGGLGLRATNDALGIEPLRILLERTGSTYVNAVSKHGRTALHLAAASGMRQAVAALIAANASVAIADENGMTPLHSAAIGGFSDVVGTLVQAGASVNAQDKHGRTPLMLALTVGHVSLANMFVELGADVLLPDDKVRTTRQSETW